ncbi:MAG: magnesium/cobalt transporter CorA [Nanoarchaeota archaeon]
MLRVFQKRGGVFKGASLASFSNDALTWVDCVAPGPEEITHLEKLLSLPKDRLHDYLYKEFRPHILPSKELSIVTISVLFEKKEGTGRAPITAFLLNKRKIVTIRTQENPITTMVEKLMYDNPGSFTSSGSFLYHFIDEMIEQAFGMVETLDDQLIFLENASFEHPTPFVMKRNYELKRNLVNIHKNLLANREVLVFIDRSVVPQLDDVQPFRFLYNDIGQVIEITDTYREVLTDIIEIYLTAIDTNLNDIVKRLSAWGSLILIPTLIASIYGMNFNHDWPLNMPELNWQYGYFFALGLMIASATALFIYFKRKRWI